LQLKIGEDLAQTHRYIDANKVPTMCGIHSNILPPFGRLGRFITSFLSSLRHEAHTTPRKMKTKKPRGGRGILSQQPYGSAYSKNQKTKMPMWAKKKTMTK
jgi:hypothetical protein